MTHEDAQNGLTQLTKDIEVTREALRERPILFSSPMVRAILEGRKSQTRRMVKRLQIGCLSVDCPADRISFVDRCPYGQPGDRLWVRETWGLCSPHDPTDWCVGSIRGASEGALRELYLVEHRQNWITHPESAHWRPSIHMPRWASRITLEITSVRVERLNEITEADAIAEGSRSPVGEWSPRLQGCFSERAAYKQIWERINGPGSWDLNPWVWVVEFKRLEVAR